MDELTFSGPLFIVGMPRSGTKLIRDLLNQNPQIAIPESETHFIPYWIDTFGLEIDFEQPQAFDQWFDEFCSTPFYDNMRGRGKVISADLLRDSADLRSWPSIIETLMRFYAPDTASAEFIWGDKTPGYVTHMTLLNTLFPEARFIHIIRDPRDYALSVRKAWGKNIYLAAYMWQKTLLDARKVAPAFGDRYKELFYETLLSDPTTLLQDVCAFLDITYVSAMTTLRRPSENLGDAKGHTEIVQDNTGKYLAQLQESEVRRIEEIVWPALDSTPYQPHFATQYRPLTKPTRQALHLYNGIASARFHVQEKGFRQGISYFYRLHVRSSWR